MKGLYQNSLKMTLSLHWGILSNNWSTEWTRIVKSIGHEFQNSQYKNNSWHIIPSNANHRKRRKLKKKKKKSRTPIAENFMGEENLGISSDQ